MNAAERLDRLVPDNWQPEPDWPWSPLWSEAWVPDGTGGVELVIADDVDALADEVEWLLG